MSSNAINPSLIMFTALADRKDLLMVLTDRKGCIEWVNQGFALHTGLTTEQLIGKKFFAVLTSNSQINVHQAYIREQLIKGESFKFEFSYININQNEHWLLVDGQPSSDAEGIVKHYTVLLTDITLRKRTEKDLEENRQRLKRLVESVNLVPWEATAANHQFTYVGPQAIQLLGYDQAQWYEPNFWYEHLHPEDKQRSFCHQQISFPDKDDYEIEYRLLSADGRWVWVKDIVTVVRHQGEVKNLIGFLINISNVYEELRLRKQAELSLQAALKALETANEELENRVQQRTLALYQEKEKLEQALLQLQKTQTQLIQREKMSSLGQLIAGVAHEINNPVNFIYANLTPAAEYFQQLQQILQCYQQQYPDPSPQLQAEIEAADLDFILEDFPKLLSSMMVGASRITEIVLSLRNFSRLDEAQIKPVDIHLGIESTLMILQHRLTAVSKHSEIQIIKEYGDLPLVECYAGQINQVFMNIIANAIDALQERDRQRSLCEMRASPSQIIIRTELIHGDSQSNSQDKLHLQPSSFNSAPYIVIWIIDNGPGMSEAVRSHLFDPFFTTKPVGQGTGLGLSISYQIVVEKHQGKLECYSTPGKGTEFAIAIPQHFSLTKPTKPAGISYVSQTKTLNHKG